MAGPDRGAGIAPASALTYCWVGGLRRFASRRRDRVGEDKPFVSLLPKASREVAKFFLIHLLLNLSARLMLPLLASMRWARRKSYSINPTKWKL
jgi:hypothetical protein